MGDSVGRFVYSENTAAVCYSCCMQRTLSASREGERTYGPAWSDPGFSVVTVTLAFYAFLWRAAEIPPYHPAQAAGNAGMIFGKLAARLAACTGIPWRGLRVGEETAA